VLWVAEIKYVCMYDDDKDDDDDDDETMLLQCRTFHFARRGKYTLLATRAVLLTIVHSTRSELKK